MHIIRTTPSFLVIIFTLLFSKFAFPDTIKIDTQKFSESYTETVNISGSTRTGVMYESSLHKVNAESLYIDIGDTSSGMLCAKLVSVDGLYEASFELKLKNKWQGINRFILPSRYNKKISHYPPNHIAVLAELKPKCKGKTLKFAPASWGSPIITKIRVLINSGGLNTHIKLYEYDGSHQKLECHYIDAQKKVAFDTECIISEPGRFLLHKSKILRSKFNSRSAPIKLPITISN